MTPPPLPPPKALAAATEPIADARFATFPAGTRVVVAAVALTGGIAIGLAVGLAGGSAWHVLASAARFWWLGPIAVAGYLGYRSYRLFIARIERGQMQARQASDVQMATIEALALAIEAKDRTSQAQIRKMQAYAAGLARAVGMSEDEIRGLRTAALLHDIGNLAVPEHILSKPGPLTYEEFLKVKTHPRVGAEILKDVPFPYPVASLILAHHEHWDGNGYPVGLKGDLIPLGARVLAVVDSYSSLSCDRPHRPARPYNEVIMALRQVSGSLLDPALVAKFIEILPVLEFQCASEGQALTAPVAAATTQLAGGVLEDIAVAHQEARALYQIAQALVSSSPGIAETMKLIAHTLGELVPYSCAAVFLRQDDRSEQFECRWASGTGEERIRSLTFSSPAELEPPLASVNRGGEGPPLQSQLVAPLVFNGSLIGFLAIYHIAARFYSPEHRRVFLRVAEQAAPVIRNSVLFERTQADSFTDHLTTLPNRRYMMLYLNQQMARAERRRSKLAVVMLDLDHFKDINDQLGHQTGDRALHELASVLRSMVRAYDLCVRYGGDEFVIILWECDAAQADRRLEEIQQAVGAMEFEAQPGDVRALSVSAGVAVFPEDGHTHEELLAVADRRMYQQKAEHSRRAPEPEPVAANF